LTVDELQLTFDVDTQLLHRKPASDIFKVLDEIVLGGFNLPVLPLTYFYVNCGKTLRGTDEEGGLFEKAAAWMRKIKNVGRGCSSSSSSSRSCSSSEDYSADVYD